MHTTSAKMHKGGGHVKDPTWDLFDKKTLLWTTKSNARSAIHSWTLIVATLNSVFIQTVLTPSVLIAK